MVKFSYQISLKHTVSEPRKTARLALTKTNRIKRIKMHSGLLTADSVWMMLATALVFFMHTGFAFLEIGLTRQKNTINILFKNIFIITGGLLLYYAFGFKLMYPGFEDGDAGILKFAGFGIGAPEGGMTPDY